MLVLVVAAAAVLVLVLVVGVVVVVLGWAIGDTSIIIMSIGVSRRGIRIWGAQVGVGVILLARVVMVDGDGGGRGTRKEGGGRRGGDGFAWRGRRGGRGR